ncbi:MAG TPA: tetratricopeptide repeat protein [Pyrinomonadaceae bacterium]|nr:tetratricopeptide repeat protein [Pyrinomonadaceae bacterium]
MYRLLFSIVLIAFITSLGSAQDLGSSNKLFGKDAPKKDAPRKSVSKNSNARKTVTRKVKKQASPDRTAAAKISVTKKAPVKASSAKLSPEQTGKLKADAADALKAGDLSAAETKYREVVKNTPEDTGAKLALSGILATPVPVMDLADRYEEAMDLAKSVSEKEPSNAAAFERLGVAREMLGLVGPETENAYRTAIRLAPDKAVNYAYLARLLRRNGNTAGAAEMDASAATRARGAAQIADIAAILQSEQRYPAAERLLTAAVQSEPKNARVLRFLGISRVANGEVADGIANLKASLAADMSNFDTYSSLASAYLRISDLANAENILLRGSRFAHNYEKPVLARQLEQLGDAYTKAGKGDEARRSYKLALTYQPERETVLAKLK